MLGKTLRRQQSKCRKMGAVTFVCIARKCLQDLPLKIFGYLIAGFMLSLGVPGIFAQSVAATPATSPMSGVSTGGTHAAVYDKESRPITAGGFVESGPVVFQDISQQAGLTMWHHILGTPEKAFIIESLGGGVALLDYDNDGWLDIYLVNGLSYGALAGKTPPQHAALFHNNHDGTFTDVTEKAGVGNARWGVGVAVGDYDNDGWPDLYVTNFGKNRLYHNNHDGTFTDVAEKAGVALGTWSTGPTFGDYDNDGRLDLFVPAYVAYDLKNPPAAGVKGLNPSYCQFRGVPVYCGPRGLRGEHDHLFHNNGDGTFTDVTVKAGISDDKRYGLTAVFAALRDSGKLDLAVANDSTPNYLYRNKGDGTFEDVSFESGYAVNGDGREMASMGIGVGDYLNNGRLDLLNSNFSDDYKVLYRNDGDLNFTDISYPAGIAGASIPFLSWGVGFLDFDNDGWKDIFIANGHVYPPADKQEWGTSWRERPLLFRNLGKGTFAMVPPVTKTGLAIVVPARGAAFGDLFNNGKIDVVLNNIDSTPTLLRNVNADHHHWVELKLIGGPKSPRDAVGASVYLTVGKITQRADVISGGSFASSNDPRVHFGLGEAANVDKVEIHWPSASVETIHLPAVDQIFVVHEGGTITRGFAMSAIHSP